MGAYIAVDDMMENSRLDLDPCNSSTYTRRNNHLRRENVHETRYTYAKPLSPRLHLPYSHDVHTGHLRDPTASVLFCSIGDFVSKTYPRSVQYKTRNAREHVWYASNRVDLPIASSNSDEERKDAPWRLALHVGQFITASPALANTSLYEHDPPKTSLQRSFGYGLDSVAHG